MNKSDIKFIEGSRLPRGRPYVDGVIVHRRHPHGDFFTGTATTLIAAGLVRIDMLPGQPGQKMRTTWIAATESPSTRKLRITRLSESVFVVWAHPPSIDDARRDTKFQRFVRSITSTVEMADIEDRGGGKMKLAPMLGSVPGGGHA